MPKYYNGWDILPRLQKDVESVTKEVSEAIVKEWRYLVDTLFYRAYTPQSYKRTNESIDSIGILSISGSNGSYQVEIGYDDSKINTYDATSDSPFISHETPSHMGGMIESGEYGGIFGHDPNGIQSIDKLNEMIKSGHFNRVVESKLKKLGYDVTFK